MRVRSPQESRCALASEPQQALTDGLPHAGSSPSSTLAGARGCQGLRPCGLAGSFADAAIKAVPSSQSSNSRAVGRRVTGSGRSNCIARRPVWVASGYSAHTGVRPLHLAQLSLRFERQRCDGDLTIRRDRCQASRGHERPSRTSLQSRHSHLPIACSPRGLDALSNGPASMQSPVLPIMSMVITPRPLLHKKTAG